MTLIQNLKTKIKSRRQNLSPLDYLLIPTHPLILPFTSLISWMKSLKCTIDVFAVYNNQTRFQGFHPRNTINSLFYITQWVNMRRYGRSAKSPIIGLGDFELSKLWHLSSISSCIYSYAGAVTTLLGTLTIVLTHFMWLKASNSNLAWVFLVIAFLFSSTTVYIMAFVRQNYQVLAWMFIPIAFFGLLNEFWILSAAAFFFAALTGITSIVSSAFIVLIFSGYNSSIVPILAMLPAILVIVVKLILLLTQGDFRQTMKDMGKLIGVVRTSVRYKRKSMRLNTFNLYFFCLYGLAVALVWYGKGLLPILLISAYLLFILNQRFVRFADDQSVIMIFIIAAACEAMLTPYNWQVLLGFVIACNPMPSIFNAGGFITLQQFQPFDVNPLISKLKSFLLVPPKTKVLFAFEDPGDDYGMIFDGYRVLLEAPLLAAAEKDIHLFPDWYAVLETNYWDAPSIWGRSLDAVKRNLSYWDAEYVIVYQNPGSELAKPWLTCFDVVSKFDWKDMKFDTMVTKGLVDFSKDLPVWWLLKKAY